LLAQITLDVHLFVATKGQSGIFDPLFSFSANLLISYQRAVSAAMLLDIPGGG
jgi:hypothetical protein